jgi:EpsI family protein
LPNRETPATYLLVVVLLAVGGFAWWLQLRPGLRVESSKLATLPTEIDGWHGSPIPLEENVESVLRADANAQRIYENPETGEFLWLYVGYYGTARGGRPEHTPRGCYTGAGWAIVGSQILTMAHDETFRVNEFHVASEGVERLVHFWYRSYRRTGMVGGLDQNLDRLTGRLLEGRADGALIRLSTILPADGDLVAARSRLQSFAAVIDEQIAARWPDERPASG